MVNFHKKTHVSSTKFQATPHVSIYPPISYSSPAPPLAQNPVFIDYLCVQLIRMASTSTTSAGPESENEAIGAFHQIAPSTSGASSSLIQKPAYHVFINHRGPDCKKTLASRIYNVLAEMKVTAFLDSEELDYGDFLPTIIEAAIRGATLHIAIFSKRYAESPWCLAELSSMLKSGVKIVPIFYQVQPKDLRYVAQRKGVYVHALERHKEEARYSPEKIQEWENALYKVSFCSGEIIKNDDDEVKLLKNIVIIVLKEISNVPLVVAKHPVGLNEAVMDFENALQLAQGNQGVQIVGIWGMGGLGKTTFVKELYNKRCLSMERSSFIFDIRDAKKVLQNKQIQLLKDLGVNETFDNVEQGKAILARHLRYLRVLIVMDDIDHVDQLDAMIPAKEHLGRGSLIIVTTREREVLTSWGISFIYKMKELDQVNARKLFCWHAFLQAHPFDGFEELVTKFVEACHGLPLSLKVFGAQLYGNPDKQLWESLFHKISRILHTDIKERLKVSYNALDDEEKEAFLDIACFFIGEKSSLAIEVWDGSGWSGLHSWERLLNKCLVELDYGNHIKMHDHLRDLGREIANQHMPYRLWSSQQIINANKQAEKINVIRGIKAVPIGIKKERSYGAWLSLFHGCWSQKALTGNISGKVLLPAHSLVELKLLVIRGDYFNQVVGDISRELVWLRWFQMGQSNLPARFSLKNLRVLELHEEIQLEGLWEAESNVCSLPFFLFFNLFNNYSMFYVCFVGSVVQAPMQLRELLISDCPRFQRFPNSIGCLKDLKRIVIKYQNHVRSLSEEFCCLQMLEHLELPNSEMLSSLPDSFGNLTNLRYLDLSGCTNLRSLPLSFKNLMLLQYLNLKMCSELILRSDDFENIANLEFLSLAYCTQLEDLPWHITNQASLRELDLDGVKRLRELPVNFGQLSKLQKMYIGSDLLKSLPNSLRDLSSLSDLSIYDCPNLECLPNSLGDLFSLTILAIDDCPNLESLPNCLENLSSLVRLSIHRCPKLKFLPPLNLLEHLWVSACPISQVDFGATSSSFAFSNLKHIRIEETEVCRIFISKDHYPHLKRLELLHNNNLVEIEALPENLECLDIWGCSKLDELPSFARLTSLREFGVQSCNRIEKIQGLNYCKRLERLRLHTSWDVPGIDSLDKMEKLRQVELRANKGSTIQSCIKMIQKWPEEMTMCMRVAPDASSVLDSLLISPNIFVIDSFSNKDIFSQPELQQKHSSNGNAIVLSYIINCACDRQMKVYLSNGGMFFPIMEIDRGRWALIVVFTQLSKFLNIGEECCFRLSSSSVTSSSQHTLVDRGLAVRGEHKELVKAVLPLLLSI